MKLVPKLTLAMVLGMYAVLVVDSAIELRTLPVDVRRAVLVGNALGAIAAGALAAVIAAALGAWMVRRPVRLLVERARRIGAGDLRRGIDVETRDELGALAAEIDAMAGRLSEALAQLRHADRLRTVGQLAAGVAHELGTPLNVVGAHAKAIRTGAASGEIAADGARVIEEQTARMTATIRQLLAFARKDGRERASVDLGELVAAAISLVEPLAGRADVALHVATSPDVRVHADASALSQAIVNIVVNGIQAMTAGGELAIDVAWRAATAPGAPVPEAVACVEIRDTGPGIAPRDLERMFEPFFTTKAIGEGTGLGLSVAYGIVHEHGGWIAVDSELGRGTHFAIHLPLEEHP
jgi:signal transduction histidine kinase